MTSTYIVRVFDNLPSDITSKFKFIHQGCFKTGITFYLNDEVPCRLSKRYLVWMSAANPNGVGVSTLSAGLVPIACSPSDPEQVERAFREGLRQLATGEIIVQNPLDELEQICLRGLKLINLLREKE